MFNSLFMVIKDKLISRVLLVALISDGLLLLPFFFTSNLFSKILPSGNLSSLVVLLLFSILAQNLSKTYERLRTAGLIKIQRRALAILEPQEGLLLFASGRELTPSIKLLQAIFILMKSGEFIIVGGAALQVFFPICVLALIFFVSIKLFIVIFIFLLLYGLIFQKILTNKSNKKKDQDERIDKIKSSWFLAWMGKKIRSEMSFIQNNKKNILKPWTSAISSSNVSSFRYSSSLVLLSLCAFFIILESLPTGYLLPISFFSQRLLTPSERIKQVSLIYKIFIFVSANYKLSSIQHLPMDIKNRIDSINFKSPIEFKMNEKFIQLSNSFELLSGQMMTISGAAASGKTQFLEAVLGNFNLQKGIIEVKSKNKQPWNFIKYLKQSEMIEFNSGDSFYKCRLHLNLEILNDSNGYLIVIDDPLMGMDGLSRQKVIESIEQAKNSGAILVIASNDRQIVSNSDYWLSIDESGAVKYAASGALS